MSDTTLYLIRHAATEQNESRPIVLQGCGIDGPLSASGRQQARAISRVLSHLPFSHVFASPLRRAGETADAIAEPHGLHVETLPEFYEVNVGDWEGLSWTQIMQEQPQAYARFISDCGTVPYRGGESYGDVLRRVKPVILDVLSRHEGESIALIGHNVVNRALLADLLGLPLKHAKDIRQSNCGVNVIRGKRGKPELVTMNADLELFAQIP